MKRTIKLALLACLILLVSVLTLTACNDKNTPEVTTPTETTPAPHIHTEAIDPAVAPTCTTSGLTEGKHCTTCFEVLVERKSIPALGHTEITNAAVAPTCTETGLTEGKFCSACGEVLVKQNIVEATGHHFGDDLTCDVCQFEKDADEISFKTLQTNGTSVSGTVSNATTAFSFIDEVAVSGKATYVVSLDIYGMQPVITKTVSLEIGDNTFYVLEQIGDKITLYTITIRRRPIYTVTFYPFGGTSVPEQYVEEGGFATEPTTSRAGYTFDSWGYDFANPIMQDTKIAAKWNANSNTAYRVEYYLQNLYDNSYPSTPEYVDNLVGTTDTTATAEQKTFDHFTFNATKSVMSGNINCNGTLVLKVYYTRNKYSLSNANIEYGTITNNGSYKYGASVTTSATANLGYDFIGWYSGDTLLSTETTYTFTIDKNVEARFAPKSEMANFHFTTSTTTCSITGIKDATVTEIIVPDYVTSIASGAFSACNNLESITLPFVGGSLKTESDTYQYPFGYIFGTSSYEGGIATKQYYYGSSTTSTTASTYYIPASLKSVTITGGNILHGAFYNCGNLTSITIADSVTNIGNYAFYCCSELISITIPNSVTNIGSSAFSGCTGLTSITLPVSVTSIGYNAFYYCKKLTNITFAGTKIQWDSVQKGSYWDSYANKYVIYCTDGIICKSHVEVIEQAVAPTCTETGLTEGKYCDVCGKILVKQEIAPALGHVAKVASKAVAPTCTETGLTESKQCSVCGEVLVKQKIVPALGHTEVIDKAVAPTCTATGLTEGKHCSVCNVVLVERTIISVVAHSYEEDICTMCGQHSTGCEKHVYASFEYGKWGICIYCDYVDNNHEHIIKDDKCQYCNFEIEEVEVPSVFDNDGDGANDIYYFAAALPEKFRQEGVVHVDAYTENLSDNCWFWDETKDYTVEGKTPYRHVFCQEGDNNYLLYNVTVEEAGIYEIAVHIRLKDAKTRGATYIINEGTANEQVFPTSCGWADNDTAFEVRNNDKLWGAYMFGIMVELQAGVNTIKITESSEPKTQQFRDFYFIKVGETCAHEYRVVENEDATCTTDGYITYTCSLCGKTKTENVPTYGHTEVIDEAVTPTCIATGLTEGKHCSECGEILVAQTEVPSTGRHTYTPTVTPPTATDDGYTVYTCVCGDTYTETIVPTDFTVTSSNRETIGYTGEEGENLVIPAVFVDNGTWYRVTSIGSSAFVSCSNLTGIKIPASVTSIGSYAFMSCSNLTDITIPDGITSIGDYTFYGCTGLTSITIPEAVTSIGANAFYDCSGLISITIPASVTSIGNYAFNYCMNLTAVYITDLAAWCNIGFERYGSNPLYYANNLYLNGELITELVIPDGITSIGKYAFINCTPLTSITLSNGVTSIGDYAFSGCSNLTGITIPESVTYIGEEAFRYCDSLASITFEENSKLTTIGQLAFHSCDNLTSITIPDSVTSIGDYAFSACKNLASVTIPDSITSIGKQTFNGCWYLTSITIPNSITSIGEEAFSGCIYLTSITFEGTVEQWNAITFGTDWNKKVPATEVICSNGVVTLS